MNVYIYDANIYCEDCGRAIRKQIKKDGFAPEDIKDESSYDSSEFPKGPYPDGGGEADSPQHCGSQGECANALTLKSGWKVGQFLENPLTNEGIEYVKKSAGELASLWQEFYGIRPERK
jgi:hypothetical protein